MGAAGGSAKNLTSSFENWSGPVTYEQLLICQF
jgi:hypothetical protein